MNDVPRRRRPAGNDTLRLPLEYAGEPSAMPVWSEWQPEAGGGAARESRGTLLSAMPDEEDALLEWHDLAYDLGPRPR
jgi:hypothetical protein